MRKKMRELLNLVVKLRFSLKMFDAKMFPSTVSIASLNAPNFANNWNKI